VEYGFCGRYQILEFFRKSFIILAFILIIEVCVIPLNFYGLLGFLTSDGISIYMYKIPVLHLVVSLLPRL